MEHCQKDTGASLQRPSLGQFEHQNNDRNRHNPLSKTEVHVHRAMGKLADGTKSRLFFTEKRPMDGEGMMQLEEPPFANHHGTKQLRLHKRGLKLMGKSLKIGEFT